jgi:hypothetical protein
MASSQGTQPSKMNKREATLAFIEVYKWLPELWDTENRNYEYNNRVKQAAAYDTLNDSPVVIHHNHTHKKTRRTDKQTNKSDGKLVVCQRHPVPVFVQVFTAQFNLECMGPFRVYGAL